jgi:hypothetical protein
MRRILLVLTLALMMAAMLLVMTAPAFAADSSRCDGPCGRGGSTVHGGVGGGGGGTGSGGGLCGGGGGGGFGGSGIPSGSAGPPGGQSFCEFGGPG